MLGCKTPRTVSKWAHKKGKVFYSSSSWYSLYIVWFPFTHTELFVVVTSHFGFGFRVLNTPPVYEHSWFRRALAADLWPNRVAGMIAVGAAPTVGPSWMPGLQWGWCLNWAAKLASIKCSLGSPPPTSVISFPYDVCFTKVLSLRKEGGIVERYPSPNGSKVNQEGEIGHCCLMGLSVQVMITLPSPKSCSSPFPGPNHMHQMDVPSFWSHCSYVPRSCCGCWCRPWQWQSRHQLTKCAGLTCFFKSSAGDFWQNQSVCENKHTQSAE